MSHTSPEESVEAWLIQTLHKDNYEQLMDGISILSSPKLVSESTKSGRRVIRFPIWAGYLDLQKRVSHYRNTTYRSLPEACEMTLRYMTGRLREGGFIVPALFWSSQEAFHTAAQNLVTLSNNAPFPGLQTTSRLTLEQVYTQTMRSRATLRGERRCFVGFIRSAMKAYPDSWYAEQIHHKHGLLRAYYDDWVDEHIYVPPDLERQTAATASAWFSERREYRELPECCHQEAKDLVEAQRVRDEKGRELEARFVRLQRKVLIKPSRPTSREDPSLLVCVLAKNLTRSNMEETHWEAGLLHHNRVAKEEEERKRAEATRSARLRQRYQSRQLRPGFPIPDEVFLTACPCQNSGPPSKHPQES